MSWSAASRGVIRGHAQSLWYGAVTSSARSVATEAVEWQQAAGSVTGYPLGVPWEPSFA